MTKHQVKQFAFENFLNEKKLLDYVREQIRKNHASWQSLHLEMGQLCFIAYVRYGYRKKTTNEYVPNSYRQKFGWKNTYYQNAMLELTITSDQFCDQ